LQLITLHNPHNTAVCEEIRNMIDISPHPLQARISALRIEHRQVKEIILKLENRQNCDDFAVKRYKKKKLFLKDTILKLEDEMLPDIIA